MRREASFARASLLRPNHAGTLLNAGVTLREVGRPAEALAAYDRALALEPDFVAAHNNRIKRSPNLKRFDEALAAADRALSARARFRRTPGPTAAMRSDSSAARRRGELRGGLAAFDRALALRPNLARSA